MILLTKVNSSIFLAAKLAVRLGGVHLPDGRHHPRLQPLGHDQQLPHQLGQRPRAPLQRPGCARKPPRLRLLQVKTILNHFFQEMISQK